MQTPAHGVVMAPVSPAVAKLLHQLQGQIIKEADTRPVPTGAAIVAPRAKLTRMTYHEHGRGYRQVSCYADNGDSLRLQTPLVGDPDHAWERPGIWYGSERRHDDAGRGWESTMPSHYVTDNFGELVPVGGAQ